MTISILLMVAMRQQPSTGLSRTLGSPLKLVMGCGSLCSDIATVTPWR